MSTQKTICNVGTTESQSRLKTKHPLYKTWESMIDRCRRTTASNYERYGGRGITVCERWHDFWLFVEDMGERPDGHTLERTNNNLGYSPDNCVWATAKEQIANRRFFAKATSYISEKAPGLYRVGLAIAKGHYFEKCTTDYNLALNYEAAAIYERDFYQYVGISLRLPGDINSGGASTPSDS